MTVAEEAAPGDGRRYALLLAMGDSEYVRDVHGGYFGVFVGAFGGDAGERWDPFRVYEGEYPSPGEVDGYDGFVVTGSPSDAHGDEPWVLRLCDFLKTLHAMGKRVLGVCFGHQVLCRALGRRVGKSSSGWDLGVRTVNLISVEGLHGFEFLKDFQELPISAPLIEIHQDEVLELPVGATVLAYSEKTGVEMFAVGDHVLGVQGHPEMDMDIMHHIIDIFVDSNTITSNAADDARRTAKGREPDRELWTGLCKLFLRGKRVEATAGLTLG